MDYLVHLLILFGIYAILAVSLDMIVGYTGIVSFSHAAFYAVGAYVGSLMQLKAGTNFFINFLAAFVITAVIGGILFLLLSRLREDYLILSFFALHEVVIGVIHNWQSLTNGPAGLFGIKRPEIFGFPITANNMYLLLVIVVLALVLLFLWSWVRSPWGLMAKGLRDDDLLMSTLGFNVKLLQVLTFATGVGIAGVAGLLYAQYVGYISPVAFSLSLAITFFTYVFIGGPASIYGPIVGTAVMVAMPEVLRFVGIPNSLTGPLQQIIFGLLLVLLVFFRPQGFFGKYKVG
jgi:branched-chain amino acid transport system permease protein